MIFPDPPARSYFQHTTGLGITVQFVGVVTRVAKLGCIQRIRRKPGALKKASHKLAFFYACAA
jgi:hypothetical protein